ncbi:MAG: sigma-54-dependent Fis family transcriptional regulator [Spirochaetales bacterium]|nr:sigma-54-dependent Fis family transcriptional regulator [Spirochaetales bacterium]
MRKPKILVVDDEKNIRDSIVRFLKLEQMESTSVENGLAAERILENEVFDAAVVDLKMPGINGLELLQWVQARGLYLPIIIISAFGEIHDAVDAMKSGARDYIVKPFDPEELVIRLKRLLDERVNKDHVAVGKRLYVDEKIWIPRCEEYKKIEHIIGKVSKTDTTVLITGESGTGKEVTAKRIHLLSPRAEGPFVPINLGGIPDNLLESELFGYEKGAFTGAETRKPGLIELASSGTLFLDEIGDMPLSLQVKVLRFLQDKKIQRLGSIKPIPVNTRIIAATNRDLKQHIVDKKFREDLYFRLNVINIQLPLLREMREELPELIGFFIEGFNKTIKKQDVHIKGITPDALQLLKNYTFPGNIRELENIIERAFILAETDMLTMQDFDIEPEPKTFAVKKGTIRQIEKDAILTALARWEGNRTKTAEELGITRRTLFNKMKEYGIESTV